MAWTADPKRYASMTYNRCGRSGIKLPAISLGLWNHFGDADDHNNALKMLTTAFDLGINHFDLANNYGPPLGGAERTLGSILHSEFSGLRDELLISTKAGYSAWPGPYGDWGSRKYLLASLDQSLHRLGLDYVDIFYSHRPDPATPLEETMGALDSAVQQGKALYVGISSYNPEQTHRAAAILREMGTPCLIHQPRYSMLAREAENGLFDAIEKEGMGCIVFSPLAKGLLTDRYLAGIPADSRAATGRFLKLEHITKELLAKTHRLNDLARDRGQTLAGMALAWVLREKRVTSALIGASRPEQIVDNVTALKNPAFAEDELALIDSVLK
ncbi:MAG TPA: aldo/keto reductase [Sedimentisphaerales bacterium]|nr:aldo/keto reductase [Sedimentisphaerales bacterium]